MSKGWFGVFQNQPAGWIGQCEGRCRVLYILEEADVDHNGWLKNFSCFSSVTGPPGTGDQHCMGQIRELPDQDVLKAAWALGGHDGLRPLLKSRKV